MRTKFYIIICMLLMAMSMAAQKLRWCSPYTGYSNTENFKIEEVVFTSGSTIIQADVVGDSGDVFQLSSEAYLSADGKRYPISKVKNIKLDKPFTMPNSGRMHVEMTFPSVPSDVKTIHFAETDRDYGWKLCNIRPEKDGLHACVPLEWENVTNAVLDTLPSSKFSNDTTVVELKVLNYTQDMGRSFNISYSPVDYCLGRHTWSSDISEDGTAAVRIHTCYPLTVYAQIGNSSLMPIVVMPGGKLSMLADAGNMGGSFKPMAFKGTLASVNYEINVPEYKCVVDYDNSHNNMRAIISSGKDVSNQANSKYWDIERKIQELECSEAAKEWLCMHNLIEYIRYRSSINLYVRRQVRNDLETAGSDILKNKSLKYKITGIDVCPEESFLQQKLCTSGKMTLYPKFHSFLNMYASGVEASELCWDVKNFHDAVVSDAMYSSDEADKDALKIKDENLRNYYWEVKRRRLLYVDSIRKMPHVHFDEYEGNAYDDIKARFFKDHKGKYLFMVAYNGSADGNGKVLDVFDSLSCGMNKDKYIIACVDVNVVSSGVEKWADSVNGRLCEMYGGLRSRYEQIFYPDYNHGDVGCYFKVFDPEGTCVLSTKNQSEMIDLMRKIVK